MYRLVRQRPPRQTMARAAFALDMALHRLAREVARALHLWPAR